MVMLGIMETKMETTIVYWGCIGIGLTLNPKPETLGGLGF